MLAKGWNPSRDIDHAVHWRPREFNKIADYLVNHTMDSKRSWPHAFPLSERSPSFKSANLLMHLDGGSRANSCSAAAWYLECVAGQVRFPVAMARMFMQRPISSFEAEAIGLDEAVEALARYLS